MHIVRWYTALCWYVYRAEIILENSDTGTELTIESNDIEQPNEVVATDLEITEAKPQAEDTVEYELQLDGEGEPDKTPDDKLESKPDPEMARKWPTTLFHYGSGGSSK